MMPSMFLGTFFYLFLFLSFATSSESKFVFNGFSGAKLGLDGDALVASNGLLSLTSRTSLVKGHAFHQTPLNFKSPVGRPLSFSTTFAFAISGQYNYDISAHGMAFLISPTTNFSTALSAQFLGLFNSENSGNSTNRILAVELDTLQNPEFQDIDDNHVGIDVNGLISVASRTAGYYHDSNGGFRNLTLHSGQPMQVWVDFDGEAMQLNVTMAPLLIPKPSRPLLSRTLNLSSVMLDSMYVGFSSATGSSSPTSHYILGWSFTMNGEADPLDYAKLPQLPLLTVPHSGISKSLAILLPFVICSFLLLVVATLVFLIRRAKYAELLEDWEREYATHRFPYRDLFRATRGFDVKQLIGVGGFGSVYRGVLPPSKREVAVKRVSHDSGSQGMKEFVAEIVSIGRLRHPNIAQLLGYCRRRGELLLIYDFMPNSSLDKYLYDHSGPSLDWARRFGIIKGVASALVYLHEEWEKVVIHRDIKASNVLLDGEWNAKLGDFGLARSCQHGIDPRSTRIIGTIGYLAPELSRTGRSSTMTDVFAFGAFLLEVACGRRPLVLEAQGEKLVLVDWVLENWKEGTVLATMDPRLAEECSSAVEIEMVLTLGLLCSHPVPEARPSMRQVTQFLDGDEALPELSAAYMSYSYPSLIQNKAIYGDYGMSL
ncbi:L-type lectin-domain containing receptor kinase IV.1-like [Iris pallida]|uniref:non-specific serine/threonine protein kinase n=1 Tax=Iris pallida TaxID=29817 RepID=A0AAX6G4E7_IRIPA|nr:L-type lectin-domain containing receptor kinase IV.1-like [Iris pallida]